MKLNDLRKTKPAETWPQQGRIAFADYSVKYSEEYDHVLRNLTFDVKPGEKIGIVGRTGAGKSSLALGLFRMLENSVGKIHIDDIDINTIGLHDLRHKLTIIPQVLSHFFYNYIEYSKCKTKVGLLLKIIIFT